MAQRSTQQRGKKEKKHTQTPQNERLKIVVRRLPPNLPEDIFWQSVLPWVTEETTTWKMFYPGKLRKRLNKENIPSRAYIAFKSEEQLALFSRHYDGHIFRDKNGVESQAVVEFAPYPKIPSDKKKPDSRNATIEKDPDYLSFIESLKAAENDEPLSIESLIASIQPAVLPKTTPLLEALKAEKSAAKDKEAILRNHAHYKQGDAALRREDKKKSINGASSSEATPRNVPPPSAPIPQRRARPVIASRQFEAALSIAGLATSASERRKRENVTPSSVADNSNAMSPQLSKREDQPTTLDNGGAHAPKGFGSYVGLDADKSGAKSSLPSPKKDRPKRGGRPGGSGRARAPSSDVANANATPIKIPSILQRSENTSGPAPVVIVPRQMSSSSNADLSAVSESPTKGTVNLASSTSNGGTTSSLRGRGRRGRGVGGRGGGGGRGAGGGRGRQVTAAATAPVPQESG